MDIYKNKYLKYKNKYLLLKKKFGGSLNFHPFFISITFSTFSTFSMIFLMDNNNAIGLISYRDTFVIFSLVSTQILQKQ